MFETGAATLRAIPLSKLQSIGNGCVIEDEERNTARLRAVGFGNRTDDKRFGIFSDRNLTFAPKVM